MKPGTYTHGPASCRLGYSQVIPAHLRGNLLELSHLEVPEAERGKGHARDLIGKICQNADDDRICLMIMPQPGSDQDALAAWYARGFGFFFIPG